MEECKTPLLLNNKDLNSGIRLSKNNEEIEKK